MSFAPSLLHEQLYSPCPFFLFYFSLLLGLFGFGLCLCTHHGGRGTEEELEAKGRQDASKNNRHRIAWLSAWQQVG